MKVKNSLCFVLALFIFACNPKEKKTEKQSVNEIPLIIGTYTKKEGHVDGKGKGIYVYAFDTLSGQMKYRSHTAGVINPSYVAAYSHDLVLAVSETPDGELVSHQFDSNNYTLKEIDRTKSFGDYPCHVSIDVTGGKAYVANYGGSIAAYHLNADKNIVRFWQTTHEGKGKTVRQEAAHAHMVATNPHNTKELFAVDLGIDKVKVYDKMDTTLAFRYDIDLPAGSGPRQIAFHPGDPAYAYVINELSGTVALLATDSANQYRFVKHFSVLKNPTTSEDAGSADIQITPSGKYLYTSTRGLENNIAIFSINAENGALTLVGHQATNGQTPRCIKLDPSGKFLLAANQDSGNIVTFRIGQDGTLIEIANRSTPTPVSLAFLTAQ